MSLCWTDLLLSGSPSNDPWIHVFNSLSEYALREADPIKLEQTLDSGDRLLADAAWDLWLGYQDQAPLAATALMGWWNSPLPSVGQAVLVLDALSVREFRLLVEQGKSRGIEPRRASVLGAGLPSDTGSFARALGLSQRSQLRDPRGYGGFLLARPSLHADLADGTSFAALSTTIPPVPNVFLWHSWLDDLLHDNSDRPDGAEQVASVVRDTLSGDDFWSLVEVLRRGRELLILSDHGYAISRRFVDLPRPLSDAMKAQFRAQRCGDAPPADITTAGGQPLFIRSGGRAAVVGPWKWKIQSGFPTLSHGGATLAEVGVPFILLPASQGGQAL